MRRTLFIMLKDPLAGRVKTRLGRDIGMTGAAWWFRHQSGRLIRTLGRDPRWHTVLAVSPDLAVSNSRAWPADLSRVPQGGGDLGARMGRLLRQAPPGPALVIGADIPGIRRADIAEAFRALGRHEAVIGPAPDGGYWLIGLARRGGRVPSALFADVRWSSAHALSDTIRSLGGISCHELRSLRDVDTLADLRALGR